MTLQEFVRRWAWQSMAAATTGVIALSALRGLASGYQPVGDNALIELRARDVLTGDHPFLGTWSSASISAGLDVNHPGPLLFELVAVPLRLFGGAAGIALAVAAFHIAMVWLVGSVSHRVGGMTAAIAAMTVTAGLVWTLGSELLYDPWQPNVLVLPFWLFICTVWAIAAGEVALFPLACGVGSFAMQTHLSYLFIVPIMLVFAATMGWRAASSVDELRKPALLSVGVIVVLWAQPLWEQCFGPGRGNFGRVITAGTGGGEDFVPVESTRTGLALGVRILGSVLALPPWWGRPGYDDSIPATTQTISDHGLEIDAAGLRTMVPSLLGLMVMVGFIVAGWSLARRAGSRQVEAGFATLTVGLVLAAATIVVTPIDILGLSPHKVRWLWVIGAFSWLMLALAVLTGLAVERRRRFVGALGLIAGLALVATVPTHANQAGPLASKVTYASIESLRSQLDDALDDHDLDRVLFDAGGIGFAEPYTAPVIAEFLRNGVDLVVADQSLSRQLGEQRRADPIDPTSGGTRSLVVVRVGQEAVDVPEGATRLAFHDGDRSPFSVHDVTERAVAVFIFAGTI